MYNCLSHKSYKNACGKLLYIDDQGNKVRSPKKCFKTNEEAIEVARKMNQNPKAIHKTVAYKCGYCLFFHVGRNGNKIKNKNNRDWNSKSYWNIPDNKETP